MRVLVLGGGYAGVTLARKLERRLEADHDLLVIDDDGQHVLQHELHRVVRRPDLAEEIGMELDALLDRATVREARVDAISPDRRTVTLDSGEAIEYDACAVAIGAAPSMAVEGVAEHGIPLKRLADARRIHDRATELARGQVSDAADAEARGDGSANVVIGGAGLSGVQVAGELAALNDQFENGREANEETETDEYGEESKEEGVSEVDGDENASTLSVTLLEQQSSVAPGFEPPFRGAIRAALDDRGIDVRTSATVERATADAVELETGESIPHDLLVWTGGITGQGAVDGDRPVVDATLELGDRTFGLGDAVRAIDRDGEAVPATAQAAVRAAETVATNVERVLDGSDDAFEPRLERFAFDPPGWVVSVGNGAVAQVGPTVVTGAAAVALKTSVGVGYLSSVGARREAVELVNQELGLGIGRE
ncbi:NAD(P)/FAD-dependent oxidoreductase [Salinarchaeum laminariae]|uniref:NAD(P)/FAD-dependent oxidoreductase n=1 Tax=Salinarchaeum laminariae TaxID=869888 RepID=UPI0020C1866F|nr:FAD-dependent oxidoreductase [Salinarchaeum laminariae]